MNAELPVSKNDRASGRGMMQTEEKVRKILHTLNKSYPDARCALNHANPFQLLVATILSAQCTDERVNKVTPSLFAAFPSPENLAAANASAVERLVRSTGFFRAKTRSLLGAAQRITKEHGGQVPRSMEELLQLPGVARKTANVVLGTAYGVPAGVVVDTHVKRIAQRLGLSRNREPEKIERDLMRLIPQKQWIRFSHQVIFHGRRICLARSPKCARCPLYQECVFPERQGIAAATKARTRLQR
jgi:endonuclease III